MNTHVCETSVSVCALFLDWRFGGVSTPVGSHTSGWSHINLLASVWYAHVSLPMCSIECSRCLRGVLYTYTAGLPTNNGMLPASVFDILARSALAAHRPKIVAAVHLEFHARP